jgi:AAA15 family ATPase/GTPase
MKYYIDNFRGLQNQIIDLKNVNFLVGENSSGKSSLIKAIALLSSFSFWMNGELATEDFELGVFDDILSVHHTRDYFSLGCIYEQDDAFNIFSFENDEGIPRANRQILYFKNNLLIIYFNPKSINYKFINKIDFSYSQVNEILQLIDSKDFKKIKVSQIKKPMIGNVPLYFYSSYLFSEDKNVNKHFTKKNIFDSPNIAPSMYIAPIRATPQSIYAGTKVSFSSEGANTPFVIKNAIKKKSNKIEILREFGRNSGLFDDVETPRFGTQDVSPFELVIRKGESRYRISSVGYGVSQILPIIVDILFSDIPIMLIQQPEVHLHPKAQAAFGQFLYKMSKLKKSLTYIIETHSDYIIDRFRYCEKNDKEKISAQVYFSQNDSKHNILQVIPIKEDGKYDENDISDYRSFFMDEAIKLMEI